jgi:EmrB/QacA subfamily drug resistance transporter
MIRSRGVLALASGAAFLSMLDATVANLAIPDLHARYPGAPVTRLSWVITAYAVAFAAVLLPAGRLADVIGRRRLYLGGIGVFTLMSLACAAAPGLGTLTAGRALQGIGAAAMIPASLAIVLHDLPAARRSAAIGTWSAAGALAAAVGPTVGGVLVDAFGWRSLFVINVPLGIVIVAFATRLPTGVVSVGNGGTTAGAGARRLPDPVGVIALAAGVAGLVVGLTEGHDWRWTAGRTLACLIGGALLVLVAIVRSVRRSGGGGRWVAAVPTYLWRNPTFALANVVSLLYGAALYASLLVGVLVLTGQWGYSELRAGLAMSPGAVTAAVAAFLVGRIVARRGPRPVVVAGAVLLAGVSAISWLWLPAEPHFLTYWLPVGLVIGIAMGAVTAGANAAAALSAPPAEFATATGLNTAARQVGGALGVAALAVIQQAAPATGTDRFTAVYAFAGAVSIAAALAGLFLHVHRTPTATPRVPAARTAPSPVSETVPAVEGDR